MLRAWQAGGADWLLDWSQRHTGWLPALLHSAREADTGPALDMALALRVHDDPGALSTLAAGPAPQDCFSMRPPRHGGRGHTGPRGRNGTPPPPPPATPPARLSYPTPPPHNPPPPPTPHSLA